MGHNLQRYVLPIAVILAAVVGSRFALAAVAVVENRTEQNLSFTVQAYDRPARNYQVPAGRVVAVQADAGAEVVFGHGLRQHRPLMANEAYFFTGGATDLDLQQIVFAEPAGLLAGAAPAGGLPEILKIPVKLVSDEPAADRHTWEPRLRKQLAEASRLFEEYCRVRWEVVAVDTWSSPSGKKELHVAARAFRQKVAPQPGWLVVGFCREVAIGAHGQIAEPGIVPLDTHLLAPEVQSGFSQESQLEYLVHQLGHVLGAVHCGQSTSVFQTQRDWSKPSPPGPPRFDLFNTLVMNVVSDQVRVGARGVADFSPAARRYLQVIYAGFLRAAPANGNAAVLLEWAHGPRIAKARFTAAWDDGSLTQGNEVGPWKSTEDRPALDGRPLFAPGHSIVWLQDNTLPLPREPEAMVEFWGWDRVPGKVVALHGQSEVGGRVVPPHLLVIPDDVADKSVPQPASTKIEIRSGGIKWLILGDPATTAPALGVLPHWVRRIVLQRAASRYQPSTLFHRDGRQLSFRAVRFGEDSVRLLREDGIETFRLDEIAELHMPLCDAWDVYFEQLATLSPDGTAQMMQLETTSGLRATSSTARFQADIPLKEPGVPRWYHMIQPVWSVEPFWLPHRQIRVRRYFAPTTAPLACLEPAASRREVAVSGAWQWRRDRNVQAARLQGGDRSYQWGFGVQAPCDLDFTLPGCVRAFRTRLGLDSLAGGRACAKASVVLQTTQPQTLYQSLPLVGSGNALDTGVLPLQIAAGGTARLVLRAESLKEGVPNGADPLDIRLVFDWFEPMLKLDEAEMRTELRRRTPQLIPAFQGWSVRSGNTEGAALVNYFPLADPPPQPYYELLVASRGADVTLTRRVSVSPRSDRLVLDVGRLSEKVAPSQIEVRVDGHRQTEFAVAPRVGGGTLVEVSLAEYAGREITLEVIQRSPDAAAVVAWKKAEVSGAEK